jgi:hypothetical protein
LTPGSKLNKARLPTYQAVVLAKETGDKQEESMKDEKDVFKIFSRLASVLNDTSKSDVANPPTLQPARVF